MLKHPYNSDNSYVSKDKSFCFRTKLLSIVEKLRDVQDIPPGSLLEVSLILIFSRFQMDTATDFAISSYFPHVAIKS